MFKFDAKFFEKYQKQLLFIANKWYLRWILGLNNLPEEEKKQYHTKKIYKITPNQIVVKIGKPFKKNGEYRQKYNKFCSSMPIFANALAFNLSPFVYFQIFGQKKPVWRFSPVGVLGCLLIALIPKSIGGFCFFGTTTDYTSNVSYSRTLLQYNGTWATVHDAATADSSSAIDANTAGWPLFYTNYAGAVYYIRKSEVSIDTSEIPDNATITDTKFYFYSQGGNYDTNSWSAVLLDNTNNGNLSHPSETEDWNDFGTTSIGSDTIANIKSAGSHYISLTDYTAVSKTGTTYIGIRTSGDIADTAPTGANINYINTGTTGFDPYLNITYTTATNWTKSLSESVSLADTLKKSPGKIMTQTLNISDVFENETKKNITDTTSLNDNLINGVKKTIADTTILGDSLIKEAKKIIADAADINDAIANETDKMISDTTELADSVAKNAGKNIIESGGGSSSSGPNSPGTMADDATVGNAAWSNPDNAKIEDGTLAVATVGYDDPDYYISHYLKATNFGFSIPAGATINGIYVEIKRRLTTGNTVHDKVVSLVKGGTVSGDNKADLVTNWTDTLTYIPYGSSSDSWGLSLTADDINSSTFGVVLQVNSATGITNYARVDHIRITVYYTETGGILLSDTIEKEAQKNISEISITTLDDLVKSINKNLSDNNVVNDEINFGGSKTKQLNETISLTDKTEKNVEKNLSDSNDINDSLTNSPEKNIDDDIGLSDMLSRAGEHYEEESILLSDQTKKSVGKNLTDINNLADNLIKTAGKNLSENVQLLDAEKLLVGKNLTEALALIDNLVFYTAEKLSISDNLTITDDLSRQLAFYRSLAETLPLTDTVAIQAAYFRAFDENIPLNDIINTELQIKKEINENVALTDLFNFEVQKSLAENLDVNDIISRAIEFYKTIVENVSINDEIRKIVKKYLSDPTTITDTIITATQFQRAIGEALTINDILTSILITTKNLTENVNIIDTLKKSSGILLSDNFLVTEILVKSIDKNLTENVDINDLISKSISYKLSISDTANIAETLIKEYNKSIGDALAIADSLTKKITRRFYKNTIIINRDKHKAILITPLKKVVFIKSKDKKVIISKPQ